MRLIGETEFNMAYDNLTRGYTGEFYLLETGAKLKVTKAHVGAGTRFFIDGYHADGRDTAPLVRKLGGELRDCNIAVGSFNAAKWL